jgi:hypothetical protein
MTHCQLGRDARAKEEHDCRGFVNRSAIGVGIWRFVEGGEHRRDARAKEEHDWAPQIFLRERFEFIS